MRFILVVHRYLAVAVGMLMTLWCLSGFVMMYQAFPDVSPEERLRGLKPLVLDACCTLGDFRPHEDTPVGSFRMEMLLDHPVLRVSGGNNDPATVINLRTGEALPALSEDQLLAVARDFARGNGWHGQPSLLGVINSDQWTLQNAPRNAPAWHVAINDAAGTELYINGRTGEVFQQTNRLERLLSWFGAIPHWLYPSMLRMNAALWTDVVIWTSVLGSFLAATGLYVGIQRLGLGRRASRQRISPYTGLWYWHHLSGLVFGVLTLTWVFSGLLTMNPWGWLAGSSHEARLYQRELGGQARWGDIYRLLTSVTRGDHQLSGQTDLVQITPAGFEQRTWLLGHSRDGSTVRYNTLGEPSPLTPEQIEAAVRALDVPILDAGLLHTEDNYYYGHKREVDLPVYRVLLDDSESTRLYINPDTGVVRSVDNTRRLSRWLRTGLHDFDFALIRMRPLWDIVVMFLLAGVTFVCATGTWMALRRIYRDVTSLNSRRQRRRIQV